MADQKNKRTAPSVQDVLNGNTGRSRAKFKSGYTGPKKPPRPIQGREDAAGPGSFQGGGNRGASGAPSRSLGSSSRPSPGSRTSSGAASAYVPPRRSGGILDYAWIAYSLVLAIALTTAIIAYSRGSGSSSGGIYYPYNSLTITGVVKDIFDDYRSGGLGSAYARGGGEAAQSDASSETAEETDKSALLGESVASTQPNSTTGAAMALDVGDSYGSYAKATSHEEVLSQLEKALAANEPEFVGIKLCYEDPETQNLIGYPQTVVEYFTKYMADNSDKRSIFLSQIKDANEFSAKNGDAYLVKLPLTKFTINMGYDETTVSISGFTDIKMDAGQSATVSPLLPCMYEVYATNANGSVTQEVESDMSEGNLSLNIGVTN